MAEKKVTKTTEENVSEKKAKTVKKKENVSTSLRGTKQSRKSSVQTTHNEIATPVHQLVRNDVKKDKAEKKESTLTVSVYDIDGKESGTLTLPEEMFSAKVNQTLMAQAVRVYLANQRQGNASTKTRGEVTGSTRKIYRQKGTGRARHGGVRAPIFVHGGIAHGPKPQDHSLDMPKKMKKAALFSALTAKLMNDEMKIVDGLETIEPKTKKMAQVLNNFGLGNKKARLLVVMPETNEIVVRTGRNLEGVTITAADRVNTYAILHAKKIIIMKGAVEKMKEVFLKK